MRVVLYAEGPGDAPRVELKPGASLSEAHLGPAHHLVRRCLCEGTRLPTGAIEFIAPLRHRGRIPRGSDLLSRRVLPRLLTWPRAGDYPDLAVLLVDEDGEGHRRSTLETIADTSSTTTAVGVAVRELESWLLADTKAVSNATSQSVSEPPAIEAMEPGQAKRLLADATDGVETFAKRVRIAQTADLERLTKLRSFEAFRKALRTAAAE